LENDLHTISVEDLKESVEIVLAFILGIDVDTYYQTLTSLPTINVDSNEIDFGIVGT
jgi:hypothetical protein